MSLMGTKSSVIIDSGSNISLISSQLISQIQPPLKIKISQVTSRSSTNEYINIDLYFDTEDGPVGLNLEAYVVKDMNAPIILGNEFADQYSLSIIRNEEGTTLHLGSSGRSISLTNSVESSYLDVKAYNLLAYKQLHNKNRRKRRSLESPAVRIKGNHRIPAHSIRMIPIQIKESQSKDNLFTPIKQLPRRLYNLTILDSIISPSQTTLHVTNDSDGEVHLLSEDIIGITESLDQLDLQVPIEDSEPINTFTNWIRSILEKPRDNGPRDQEQLYQNQVRDLPNSPKTAELPPMEDTLSKDLLITLDFNPKLTSDQKSRLEKVILENSKAFSIDRRIGRYEGIQYPIHLKEGAQPVSLAPYHALPEKREAIDKQLDKWFSQDVITESDSPWGAPVIVVYCNGKPRVCVDY